MEIDERRHSILNEVNQNRNVKISTLSKQMDVSRETIRKDIYSLAKQGLVSAVRGGAEAIVDDPTSRFDQRKAINQQAKQKMAQRALSYIKDGATIFLDSGTSSYEVAEALKQNPRHDLSIIASSTFVAQTLLVMQSIQIVLLGGVVRRDEGSVSGPIALQAIDSIYADVGFFGCGGINDVSGITNRYLEESQTAKAMKQHCRTSIVLADHSKFGASSLVSMFKLDDVDFIISDPGINRDLARQMGVDNLII